MPWKTWWSGSRTPPPPPSPRWPGSRRRRRCKTPAQPFFHYNHCDNIIVTIIIVTISSWQYLRDNNHSFLSPCHGDLGHLDQYWLLSSDSLPPSSLTPIKYSNANWSMKKLVFFQTACSKLLPRQTGENPPSVKLSADGGANTCSLRWNPTLTTTISFVLVALDCRFCPPTEPPTGKHVCWAIE